MVANPNPRICGTKVKTGCLTCKSRHLKCGEEKPYCRRCISTGRTCDGYSSSKPPVKTAREGIKHLAKELIIIHYASDLPTSFSSAISQNTKEQRSFDYFRTRTAPDLLSCFDSDLWSLYVLQLAHSEPAIRHSVIALASMHEHFEGAGVIQIADSHFALNQYSKAIRHIIESFSRNADQPTDIALLLCALFASFESLQGHYGSAVTHITSGIRVLQERQANGLSCTSHIPARFLHSLFSRLGSQVLEIGDGSMAAGQGAKQNFPADLPIPSTFSTIEEAEDSFNWYAYRLLHVMQHAEGTTADGPTLDLASLAHIFEQWTAAFDEYLLRRLEINLSSKDPRRIQTQPGVYILQIWRIVVNIFLSLDLSAGETSWDRFAHEFTSVVDLAASFIEHTSKSIHRHSLESKSTLSTSTALLNSSEQVACQNASPRPSGFSHVAPGVHRAAANSSRPLAPKPPTLIKPTFSLSLGIIPPLYIISTRCRDPAIRRKAIHILSICNRREGIWDSRLSSHVAQRILEIEETGARQHLHNVTGKNANDGSIEITSMLQIPEHVRVIHLGAVFGPERQGTFRYMKSNTGSEASVTADKTFEEHFEW